MSCKLLVTRHGISYDLGGTYGLLLTYTADTYVQCNLDLVTLNLVTTCDLVTILKDRFSIYYIKSFDLVTLCNLVTVFQWSFWPAKL